MAVRRGRSTAFSREQRDRREGPDLGDIGRGGKREGMIGIAQSNYPEGRHLPPAKVRQLQNRLWAAAKQFPAGVSTLPWPETEHCQQGLGFQASGRSLGLSKTTWLSGVVVVATLGSDVVVVPAPLVALEPKARKPEIIRCA